MLLLFLISPPFGTSGRLYFVIVTFSGYLYLYFCIQNIPLSEIQLYSILLVIHAVCGRKTANSILYYLKLVYIILVLRDHRAFKDTY